MTTSVNRSTNNVVIGVWTGRYLGCKNFLSTDLCKNIFFVFLPFCPGKWANPHLREPKYSHMNSTYIPFFAAAALRDRVCLWKGLGGNTRRRKIRNNTPLSSLASTENSFSFSSTGQTCPQSGGQKGGEGSEESSL